MNVGDDVEFTPEQRDCLLHLLDLMINASDAAAEARYEAARAKRLLWYAIHQHLNLDRTCTYRLLPRFAGVRIVAYDPTKEIDVTIDETLEEWDKKVKELLRWRDAAETAETLEEWDKQVKRLFRWRDAADANVLPGEPPRAD